MKLFISVALSLLISIPPTLASTTPQHPLQIPTHHENPLTTSLLALHKSLIRIPSISSSEQNVTLFLKDHLESRNFTVYLQSVAPNRHNILAYTGSSPQTRVLLTSHIDTVPPYLPYARHGDEIWGRGSVDAKGSVAAQITAVESLLSTSSIQTPDVGLLFVVGEEVGGPGMQDVNKLNLTWETVIFGEPTEGKLACGHKGGMGFVMRAKGKAGHSGYPELGKSAISMLVKGLAALEELELPGSEEFGESTLNIGRIEGGVAGNVIVADAEATVVIRVAGGSLEVIQMLVEEVVWEASSGVEMEFSLGIGPVGIDCDVEGFETAVMSYGTDIPNLKGDHKRYLYGPGSILVAHSDHEHLTVSDLEEAVEGYKALILASLK